MQHQTCFRLTGVESLGKFFRGQKGRQTIHTAPEKTRKDAHRWTAQAQLSCSHLKQADLAAMGVQQHQPFHPHGRQLTTDLIDKLQHQFSGEAQRAWEWLVFRRKTNRLQRQSPDRPLTIEVFQHGIQNPISE
jgi:hypothetical protein